MIWINLAHIQANADFMFCCMLLYVLSSIAIMLMGKRELVALLILSSWCLVMVERLFLVVPRGCLRFVIVVFPDHTHYFYRPRSACTRSIQASLCKIQGLSEDFQKTFLLVSRTENSTSQRLDCITNYISFRS